MLKVHEFYKKFENTPKDQRFRVFTPPGQPTSLFVIFQQLAQVRAQKRFFEQREEYLLIQAEEAFKTINNG